LNVIEQAIHVCHTTVVQDAWTRGQQLTVHAWVYGLDDGRLRDFGFAVNGIRELKHGIVTALNASPRTTSR
jgi:carbonic anhydrase